GDDAIYALAHLSGCLRVGAFAQVRDLRQVHPNHGVNRRFASLFCWHWFLSPFPFRHRFESSNTHKRGVSSATSRRAALDRTRRGKRSIRLHKSALRSLGFSVSPGVFSTSRKS